MKFLFSTPLGIILTIIVLTAAFLWCFDMFLKAHINVREIKKTLKHPDPSRINSIGFVINKKTKEVETANKIKTPF